MDKKHAYLFCKFIETEIKKINRDKYFEGIRIKDDPGQKYVIDWIKRNAVKWRIAWEASCCQHCVNWQSCGLSVKKKCKNFKYDNKEGSV